MGGGEKDVEGKRRWQRTCRRDEKRGDVGEKENEIRNETGK